MHRRTIELRIARGARRREPAPSSRRPRGTGSGLTGSISPTTHRRRWCRRRGTATSRRHPADMGADEVAELPSSLAGCEGRRLRRQATDGGCPTGRYTCRLTRATLAQPQVNACDVRRTRASPEENVNAMPKDLSGPAGSAEDNWPVLTGPDCILRVLKVADATDWYRGEDEEQRRWFEFPPGPRPPFATAVASVERCIESWRAAWRAGGPQHHWGIWTEDGRLLCGGVEVRVRADRRANVSYLVFPRARRRGLATLAVRLAAEWAFSHLDIDALVAVVDEKNVASKGVALAAGFALEGPAEAWEYSESGVMLRYAHSRDPGSQLLPEAGRALAGGTPPNPACSPTSSLPRARAE